jgi:hypothetical protein
MRLVIEETDFRRLSAGTRRELLDTFAGNKATVGEGGAKQTASTLWRRPIDLTPELTTRLLHGLSEPHRERLKLFAKRDGRVSQKELLKVTNDTEMRVLSHFQGVLSRRLRRFIDDPEKRIHVIGWDFESTKWDKSRSTIVDGIYYVTDTTTKSLQDYFGLKPKQ